MPLIRIIRAEPLEEFRVRLWLSDGSIVERDLDACLRGPVFERIRQDPALFRAMRVEGGTLVWSDQADICPDVIIWGGLPPDSHRAPEARLAIGRL